LVEQRTENPRVGGSIPSLATNKINELRAPNRPQLWNILASVEYSVPVFVSRQLRVSALVPR
jgi:hypothetical protein